jgi:hypothetical protein
MAVTASDLKFFASATMSDLDAAGGARASTVVQDGVLNNVFPSISAADRALGRVHLRKVWPSITNADTAALLGSGVSLNEVPTDPAVNVALFRYGDSTTTRAQALAAFKDGKVASAGDSTPTNYEARNGTATAGSATVTGFTYDNSASFDAASLTDYYLVQLGTAQPPYGHPAAGTQRCVRRVVSRASGTVVFDAPIPFSGSVVAFRIQYQESSFNPVLAYSAAPTIADAVSGATAVSLSTTLANVTGAKDGGAMPANMDGFGALIGTNLNPAGNPPIWSVHLSGTHGQVPFVRAGDQATLSHEAATSPATAVNAGTVDVGRTNVDQFSIVGNDGVEIVRLLKDGPTSSIASANFATGVLTFTNVSGFSQPVTVRHRIVHYSAVDSVVLNVVTFATPLTRDFDTGSLLSTHVPAGDMVASIGSVFSQQAWTRVWSDTLIGSSVPTMYSSAIGTTNQGAETDRFAIVFTSGNTFDCYSERLGKIASGNTTVNFSPINPATGAPLFTLLAVNWASGILVGSVLRFNLTGACAPVWVLRATQPSTATGNVRCVLRLNGSIN